MMDPSSAVQQQGPVEHVLHAQHNAPPTHQQDLGNVVDPSQLISSSNVTGHLIGAPPGLGIPFMHGAHNIIPTVPTSPAAVHIVSNNVAPTMSGSSPYVHPGLMQEQTEKYGPLLFHKDDQGLYTCFFTGCGKKLKANFSRHVAKHEMDGDKMDPTLASQIQTSSASKNLGTTKICSHPTHQEWWGTSPEQPVTEFYKRCSKCKKCYIRLQQESKRQRLSLESLNSSPMNQQAMSMQPYGNEMFQQGVNGIGLFEHQHLKRDGSEIDGEVDQSPNKRIRLEDSPQIAATITALADKHFKEMAELTARHSADSRKLISHNSTLRLSTDLRHAKEKEELEAKLRNEWDMFRMNCLKEREELYQTQVLALHRELQGATVPTRPCRLCNKRMLATFLYQCNLCNEEACIRCQAVMVCGVCGTKSCENCTIKHNWLIWCDRCHKTFCSNHRGIPDNLCPGCESQKSMDLVLIQHHHHGMHELDQSHQQSQSLHGHVEHLHQDVLNPDHLQMHHNQDELMPSQLKFEDLDHDHHHHHNDSDHHLHGDQSDLLQHDQDHHHHHHHHHLDDEHGMHHSHHLDEHHHHHHEGHLQEEQLHSDHHHHHHQSLSHDQDLHHHQYDSELSEHQHEHQSHHSQNGQEHHSESYQDGDQKYDDLDPHSQQSLIH